MKAAIEIAEDQKTNVRVHAYRNDAVNRFFDAGAKCVEHNFLVSEESDHPESRGLSLQGFMASIAFAGAGHVPCPAS